MEDRLPLLYSFRRCPYAIRARMAIMAAGLEVRLREVSLKNKPASMLDVSEAGTVPVLVHEGRVLDQSLDIMNWALSDCELDKWKVASLQNELVENNDKQFKYFLDRYKYFDRYPEHSQDDYFDKSLITLTRLENHLLKSGGFLVDRSPKAIDLAIFPFIRQFAHVDLDRFQSLKLPKLQNWLEFWLDSKLFRSVMTKYDFWQEGGTEVRFASES